VGNVSNLLTIKEVAQILRCSKATSRTATLVKFLASRETDSPVLHAETLFAPLRWTMETKLVDINELSLRLSIPKGTLYNWVYLRRIPFIKAGRSLRFDADEVIQSLPHSPILEEIGRGRRIIQ